jgi:predicted transcriptional regulator
MEKVIRTIELSAGVAAAVDRLAAEMGRPSSDVLLQAVEDFLANCDDLTVELERLAEYERTGISLSLEEVRENIAKKARRGSEA